MKVKNLLQKAKDSALLAIEFYNKPAVSFKSEGFITMMCIAWTSLFHAYFLKNKIKPFYRKTKNGKRQSFEKVKEVLPNGEIIKEPKWWDLSKCIKEFYKDQNTPEKKNLEFLTGIRNRIVHRNIPELDPTIFGECQANILNFNQFLIDEFGEKHRIDYMLSYSLQLFSNPKNFIESSIQELKKKNAYEIVEFIKSFRSALSYEIYSSPDYAFKAVLIKVMNHDSKDSFALRVIYEKDLTDEQRQQLSNMGVVLIKEREKKIDAVPDNYKWDYKTLVNNLRKEIPGFKSNKLFHEIKQKILENNPKLFHQRKLDPNNLKSQKKNFFDPTIIEYFKEEYNNIE